MAVAASLMTPGDTTAVPDAPPILLAISMCESGQRQYAKDGSVLESKTHDLGLFQISRIHIKEAKKLGYDIMTEEGNIRYALYLYHKNGLKDWLSSRPCWSKDTTEV